MVQTFANLPETIEKELSSLLALYESREWIRRAETLHNKYVAERKDMQQDFLKDYQDVLGYLGMRAPATYAQIYGALSLVLENIPHWQPKTLLDIGSGPGTGVWAAHTLWPTITNALCLDQNKHVISLGQLILEKARFPVTTTWKQHDIRYNKGSNDRYDLVIIANVLNELSISDRENVLNYAYNTCKGILLIVEPGTPTGSGIVESIAQQFDGSLFAPYITNSFVLRNDYWLHFSQRFIRPEFQRRIRQHMRDSSLMASDWEEAKYAFVAIGKIVGQQNAWGRCVGKVRKQKGFLEVPILTKDQILNVKVMQRHKKQYTFAKNLKWGELILQEEDCLVKN